MIRKRYFYLAPALVAVSKLVWSEASVNRLGDPNYLMPVTLLGISGQIKKEISI